MGLELSLRDVTPEVSALRFRTNQHGSGVFFVQCYTGGKCIKKSGQTISVCVWSFQRVMLHQW